MRQTISYNPDKDICEVDQFGFVDITKAIVNGYVPGANSSISVEFDGADDPSAIIGKPSDVFDAMRMQNQIIDGIKSSNSKGSSATADEH